jgi:hypothetical protein
MTRTWIAFFALTLPAWVNSPSVSPDYVTLRLGDSLPFTAKVGSMDVGGTATFVTVPAMIGSWTTSTVVGSGKFTAPKTLDKGITQADVDVTVTAPGATDPATVHIRIVVDSVTGADERHNFEATAFTGVVVDNFAGQEQNRLTNYPSDVTGVKSSYVVGIDFAYRLLGDAKDTRPFKGSQLWVYGETIHAQRSADVNCSQQPAPAVCALVTGHPPTDLNDAFLTVLRNATSLEAYTGLRWEFLTLQRKSEEAAKIYLKSELGYMTVSGLGHLIDSHQKIALGALTTNGKYRGSYLEVGYGKTDLFQRHPGRRFKVDAYLEWDLNHWMDKVGLTPFIQMTVDSDFGPGSDSVRTYYGFNFDLGKILIPGGN